MQINSLYSSIMRGGWMMEPSYVQAHLPLIAALVSGKLNSLQSSQSEDSVPPSVTEAEFKYYLQASHAGIVNRRVLSYDSMPEGSIAVFNICGGMTQEDNCGIGTKTLTSMINAANMSSKISGAVFHINSGGGEAYGMEQLSEILKSFEKPTVSFVDSVSASAAYWVASQTSHIMLSGKSAKVGSVGTMIGFADIQPALEKKGVKFHYLTATKSKEKNKDWFDFLAGNQEKMKEDLDFLNEMFLSSVKSGRGERLNYNATSNDPLNGGMYWAEQAISNGLADSIGNYSDAFNKVQELIESNTVYGVL